MPDSVDREDLVSCGIVGLISAVDRFQPHRGVKFETYATTLIWGAVMDELRAQDWAPRSVREKCRRIERTLSVLESRLGRSPEDEEMAEALNMPVDEYHRLLSEASPIALMSLEELLAGGDFSLKRESEPLQVLTEQDPEAISQQRELARTLAGAIDALPQRERLVIALYYHEELTLREIGEILGVTESRVCQIHTQAILRLCAEFSQEAEAVPADVSALGTTARRAPREPARARQIREAIASGTYRVLSTDLGEELTKGAEYGRRFWPYLPSPRPGRSVGQEMDAFAKEMGAKERARGTAGLDSVEILRSIRRGAP